MADGCSYMYQRASLFRRWIDLAASSFITLAIANAGIAFAAGSVISAASYIGLSALLSPKAAVQSDGARSLTHRDVSYIDESTPKSEEVSSLLAHFASINPLKATSSP